MVGGFVLGMGAQIFILPYVDSIAGFTVLFIFVTALAWWFMTSSPRLSYFGVQVALAFYLVNVQEFANCPVQLRPCWQDQGVIRRKKGTSLIKTI